MSAPALSDEPNPALKGHKNPWDEALPRPAEGMSSYLCIMPDAADSKRMSVRPQHLADAAVGHEKGWIIKAGAMFADDSKQKMVGSWFLIREETLEKAKKRLGGDIYATGGAFDLSKATYTPVAIAKH
ncbi:hypothetical protein JCM8097_008790 [Rhodosporidiobolus ruineniae]